jgi:uncharacterized protein YkwD
MKSPFVLFLLLLTLTTVSYAQGNKTLKFDLRPGQAESSAGVAGVTRTRVADGTSVYREPSSSAAGDLERRVFKLLNDVRREQGLQDLEWSDDVAAVARVHSLNMADEKFFSHRGSDGSMVDDRADRLGLGSWRVIGENIAYMRGYDDPATLAVEKWMESTAHRKNLLGPNWKESAVGVAITKDGTYYMTQVFLLRK